MNVPLYGGCLCGAIRFECRSAPISAAFCHCRNCQKAHAAPYAAVALMPPGSIVLLAGEPKRHEMIADSGAAIFREFCGQCGTQLFSGGDRFPQFKAVKIVALDDPAAISPVVHAWTENRIKWACIDDGLPRLAKQGELSDAEQLWARRTDAG